MYHVENDSIHTEYICQYTPNTYQYVLVCIEYIPIPPLRIGHVLMHVFRYVFACINYWYVPIHTKYASNTCKIRINTDWYVSIHTRHVSIHALNTYKNTYQNTYQYGAVVLVRICTYQVSIRALHFPDVLRTLQVQCELSRTKQKFMEQAVLLSG